MHTKTSSDAFGEDYFERGQALGVSLYTNYRWLPHLTVPMCEALIYALEIKRTDRILDFGCAKGYVVKAFRLLGYEAFGCDISEYAIANADPDTAQWLRLSRSNFVIGMYEWILAKDVLEHVEEAALPALLREMRGATTNLFVTVPLGDGERYVIPASELDSTHRIRQPISWWIRQLHQAGFKIVQATYSMPGVKEQWKKDYPEGNGFLVVK